MSGLAEILRASREFARCSCGWSGGSATRPGAVLLATEHHRATGLEGHTITLGGAR